MAIPFRRAGRAVQGRCSQKLKFGILNEGDAYDEYDYEDEDLDKRVHKGKKIFKEMEEYDSDGDEEEEDDGDDEEPDACVCIAYRFFLTMSSVFPWGCDQGAFGVDPVMC